MYKTKRTRFSDYSKSEIEYILKNTRHLVSYGTVSLILKRPHLKLSSTKNVDNLTNRSDCQSMNLLDNNMIHSISYTHTTRQNAMLYLYPNLYKKGHRFPDFNYKTNLLLIPIIKIWSLYDILRYPNRVTTRKTSLHDNLNQPDFSEQNAGWGNYDLENHFELIFNNKRHHIVKNPIAYIVNEYIGNRETEFRILFGIDKNIPIIKDYTELMFKGSKKRKYINKPSLLDLRIKSLLLEIIG